MIQHEDNEREARDASRELSTAIAVFSALIALAWLTVSIL